MNMEILPSVFVSSSVSFISVSVLQFSEYRSFISLVKFIPRYFILLDVMVNGIVSFISLSDHCYCIGMQQIFLYLNFASCHSTKFTDEL